MTQQAKYNIAKDTVNNFIAEVVDTGELSNREIARLLVEISLKYMKQKNK